jgi:hypothetical protein
VWVFFPVPRPFLALLGATLLEPSGSRAHITPI